MVLSKNELIHVWIVFRVKAESDLKFALKMRSKDNKLYEYYKKEFRMEYSIYKKIKRIAYE